VSEGFKLQVEPLSFFQDDYNLKVGADETTDEDEEDDDDDDASSDGEEKK
jgi:hypothetical protein